jgi:chemotaxis protein MotB
MFLRTTPTVEPEEAKDVFAPVADLMVGVVFIFIVLMLALVINIRSEDSVPKSLYVALGQQLKTSEAEKERLAVDLKQEKIHREVAVARVRALDVQLAAEIERKLALERKNTSLTERLNDEVRLREVAIARQKILEESNARLVAFVRFVQEKNLVQLLQRLAVAGQARLSVLNQIRDILGQSNVQVTLNTGAGTLMLPARELFGPGQSVPTREGEQLIRALARAMAKVLPCYAYSADIDRSSCVAGDESSRLSAVYIEGHTDVNPVTPTARLRNNWDLSAARAISAFDLLRSESDELKDLMNRDGDALIGVSGYAETRPSNRTARDRRQPAVAENDRRIEIRVIMTTNEEFVESILRELNLRIKDVDDLIR